LWKALVKLELNTLHCTHFQPKTGNVPQFEVDALMGLLVHTIDAETQSLMKNNVRLSAIGDIIQDAG
jgi:undecaprenyl diphosphate synthase